MKKRFPIFTDEELEAMKEDAWQRMKSAAIVIVVAVSFWVIMGLLCYQQLDAMLGR